VVLIAAGWFGWQRPWLFGVAAGVLGLFVLLAFAGLYPEPFLSASAAVPSGTQLLVFLVYQFFAQLPLLLLLGFVAGWYGGYLRRRLTDQRPPDQRQRRR
jgi:NhaP-type Na+/H+ or K+/H+ antiporter